MHNLDFVYDMGMGETRQMTSEHSAHYLVTRVPGGWLFTLRVHGEGNTTAFVPYLKRPFE